MLERGDEGDLHPISVLIIDDERPARRKLHRLLGGVPGITKVYEAPSGRLALDVIEAEAPDVVFLDVRMPGLDGFQLLEALGPREETQVVFVTAYDEHAVRAFDVNAVDYLLKPYDDARFRDALERARRAVVARAASAERRELSDVVAALQQTPRGGVVPRLLVDGPGGRQVLLPPERVIRVQSHRNDAVFHTADRTYRLRTTLAALASKLDPHGFLRISRSEIVNLDHVAEIEPLDHGDALVHMVDGDTRRLTRRFRDGMRRFR